jgi:hypothetical protein
MAHAQLHLIELDIDDAVWKLDQRTIQIGRRGLAQARAALALSAQREREREQEQEQGLVEEAA